MAIGISIGIGVGIHAVDPSLNFHLSIPARLLGSTPWRMTLVCKSAERHDGDQKQGIGFFPTYLAFSRVSQLRTALIWVFLGLLNRIPCPHPCPDLPWGLDAIISGKRGRLPDPSLRVSLP